MRSGTRLVNGRSHPVWTVIRHPRYRAYTETSRCPTWPTGVRTGRDAVTPVVIPVSWSSAEVALCSPAARSSTGVADSRDFLAGTGSVATGVQRHLPDAAGT